MRHAWFIAAVVIGIALASPDLHEWQETNFPDVHISDTASREVGWALISAALIGVIISSHEVKRQNDRDELARQDENRRDRKFREFELERDNASAKRDDKRERRMDFVQKHEAIQQATNALHAEMAKYNSVWNDLKDLTQIDPGSTRVAELVQLQRSLLTLVTELVTGLPATSQESTRPRASQLSAAAHQLQAASVAAPGQPVGSAEWKVRQGAANDLMNEQVHSWQSLLLGIIHSA